jgi:aspartyl-tRNA(Asn)/glutamyl-tRNA(Gln) amidotransferase subunit A
MTDEITDLGVGALSRLIATRKLSPWEVVEAYLDRIPRLDPALGAFMEVTAERARAEARRAEAEISVGSHRGPLHGIPFVVKDIIDVEGLKTTCGSRLLADHVATRTADCVERLSTAGAILLGKTATYEFATGGPSFDLPWPPTRNPWNLDHGSGGSSTGSAAAVAAGMAPLALGSDTGGSIRVPASYCGVTGLKPSFGRIGTDGVWPLAETFDTVGLLCRTAEDAALGFQVVSENAAAPALTDDLRGLRIGLVRAHLEGARAEVLAAVDEAMATMRSLGATVTDAALPGLDMYGTAARLITAAEAFTVHRRALVENPGIFGEMFRYRVLPGVLVQGSDYVAAQQLRRALTQATLAAFKSFDVLVSASTLGPAPAFATMSYGGRLTPFPTIAFSLTGLPAVSICNGFAASGLPLGMQIAGRPLDEAAILRVAHAYQRVTTWHERRPAPSASSQPTRMPDWTPSDLPDDPAIERQIDASLTLHGIRLSDRQRRQLREGGDTVVTMAAALRDAGIG